jgi:hypothetical protein
MLLYSWLEKKAFIDFGWQAGFKNDLSILYRSPPLVEGAEHNQGT